MRGWWMVIVAACGSSKTVVPDAPGHAAVRVLAINDFHGALENDAQQATPGIANLAAAVASQRTGATVFVSAGDLIGGSPLTSALFHDEPTIDLMNAMGLDYNAVGNHEFDEGNAELQRMQHGGCHPVDGCGDGVSFAGASFEFLAANVSAGGQTIFPPYAIRDVGGAKVAFVGMTLKGTPAATDPSKIPELAFADEVDTMNALVPEIQAEGAQAIVLLLHQGGDIAMSGDCSTLTGPIVDIANRVDPAVVWIASAHSHKLYNCMIGGRPITSAGAHGIAVTTADLEIDLATGSLVSITTTNMMTAAFGPPDPAIAATVDTWVQRAAPLGDRVVGTITTDIGHGPSAAGELEMGDVITDAMLEATGAQAALMNPGGVRAALVYAATPPETADGQVRYREAFAVQPFQNNVFTVAISGADLVAALDHYASPMPLQVAGLAYAWHPAAAPGSRVTAADVTVGGSALVTTASYRVAVNSIVGNATTTPSFANATDPVGYGVDLDILTAYITAHSPLSLPTGGRITEN